MARVALRDTVLDAAAREAPCDRRQLRRVAQDKKLSELQRVKRRSRIKRSIYLFAAITVATFASGALQNTLGWSAVNLAVALPLIIAFVAVAASRRAPVPA